MDLRCHVCGTTFRTAIAEAKHRHNFPALCKNNKQFKAFHDEMIAFKWGPALDARTREQRARGDE